MEGEGEKTFGAPGVESRGAENGRSERQWRRGGELKVCLGHVESDRLESCIFGDSCSKLLNSVWPEAVDERALNRVSTSEAKVARSQALENNTLFLKAAGSVGCNMPSVTPEDLTDGKVRNAPHVVTL